MATFVLIHGGGGSGWDWHLVGAELRRRGHDVVAPDLPIEDPAAKLADFRDAVVSEVGERADVVVVAHSYGGFTAPLVADRLDARLLVFVAGMVPAPGETPGQWWENSGYTSPSEKLSVVEQFLGDVPAELAEENIARGRDQRSAEWDDPWPLAALPDLPTRALLCREDRLFPPDLQRHVAKARLGITPDEISGSHMVLLSRPVELAERLEGYFAALR
ncbi:alpha/beta fold hydrolase [Amycolatopsis saalfeldensis]|uniref:Alpha/beta hydrolase family protein n=1 Tax=Amycolatopsis saalfeldensis TaxID=394193 RepID=A0A1H8YCY8_9PSEU|nr:alpha/beta hydrolase [Amycolatopsis saalfeldensis]SEP49863.1 Alpha/beta hydrolase family protein [Amycolatopsis saalfeldensis]